MKKSTKLLSVLLAFVMILSSATMFASAAKANYKSVANLTSLGAYNEYGTVTRLSTEERVSILFDFLDLTLGKKDNLNMGEVFNLLGTGLTINLTSVDAICGTVDNFKSFLSSTLVGAAMGLMNFGTLESLSFDNWTSGYTRANNAQIDIILNLLNLLKGNSGVFSTILTSGIDLGIIKGALGSLPIGAINSIATDLPKTLNKVVMPLMGRPDDTGTLRNTYMNSTNATQLLNAAQSFVTGLFTKPMNWTSYRTNGSGTNLGYTSALPTKQSADANTASRYFVVSGSGDNTTITQYDYEYPGLMSGKTTGEWKQTVTYTRELEAGKTNVYIYKAPDGYEGDQTLKWYKADGFVTAEGVVQSAYWVPSLATAMSGNSPALTLQVNGTDTVVDLIYKFAPYLFREMAVTVLNGSVKKLIAELFDVEFTKIGDRGSSELTSYLSSKGISDTFFTEAQSFYIWEYSNYKVINGIPYYRFQEEYFVGKLPSNLSTYYNIFNWNWNISADFIDEFVPAKNGQNSTAGYNRILKGLNDFVRKIIDNCTTGEYRTALLGEWEAGDLTHAKQNILNVARYVVSIAPEEIFGDYYYTAQFYDAMMTGTMDEAVNGLVCELVKMIMPQMIFSTSIKDEPVTAILAVVVRELCTQLMPTYDFDAMIYSDYSTRTVLTGKSADYWLDTSLYMGVNLGMYYLRNLADIGEDNTTVGYYGAMKNLGAIPSNDGDAMTFGATAQYVGGTVNSTKASWLYMVDWVMDWAMESEYEWCWSMERLVDLTNEDDDAITIDLKTYQNPFEKISSFLLKLLPFNQLFNVSGLTGTTYGSESFLEKFLKDGLVDSIATLDFNKFIGLVDIPSGIFTSQNILNELVKLVRNLLNTVLYKVAGNSNIVSTSITTVATLLNQANLRTTVVNLINKLYAAQGTYNLLQPVMPIVGFFVGWKTDPQELAPVDAVLKNSAGEGFFYTGNSATNTLTVYNNCSGMLLKHRDSSTTDQANDVVIKKISSPDGYITCSTTNTTIQPYSSYTFTLTANNSANNKAETIVIEYTVKGKDGTATLGGTQYAQLYTYVSSTATSTAGTFGEQTIQLGGNGCGEVCNIHVKERPKYYFVSSADDIAGVGIESENQKDKATWVAKAAVNTNATAPVAIDTTSYVHGTGGENENLKALGIGHWIAKQSILLGAYNINGPCTINFSTVSDESLLTSGTIYSGGKVNITLQSGNGMADNAATIELPQYYYSDVSELQELLAECQNFRQSDFSNTTAWNTFVTARDAAIVQVYRPRIASSFTTDFKATTIASKVTALRGAIDALEEYRTVSVSSDVAQLQAKLDQLEPGPDDINFQDHELFEYFKYENQRTATRAMLNAYKQPEAPTKYIEGEDLTLDQINAIKATQNAKVALGIDNTLVDPSTESVNAYNEAVASWRAPGYTALDIQNQKALLQYYYGFMIEKAADLTFLNREITAAPALVTAKAAGNTPATYFSADSWTAYTDALNEANAVAAKANPLESEVFEAKYNLEYAVAQLMPKFKSMKDNGYLDEEIKALIAHANAIIDNYGTVYSVKSGVTEADAFGALVKALGVDYTNDRGEDAILYGKSAKTFTAYDREQTAKNKSKVDDAADELRAAIENFECTVKLTSADATNSIDQTIRFIKGITPGTITSVADLLTHVTATSGATTETQVSKAGGFGTGAKVDLKYNSVLVATYFVVIYGDANGDGSIDGLDAAEVALATNTGYYMGDVYDDAADVSDDGLVNAADYSAIKAAVLGTAVIDQRA